MALKPEVAVVHRGCYSCTVVGWVQDGTFVQIVPAAKCGDSWHPGLRGLPVEERALVLGRRCKGTSPEDHLRDADLQNQARSLRAARVQHGHCQDRGCNKMGGARLCRCPVCGQENLREGGNNLLRCWSCTSRFCCACRAWLRGRRVLHFVGANVCKQHGA